jgi:hypothetical protein
MASRSTAFASFRVTEFSEGLGETNGEHFCSGGVLQQGGYADIIFAGQEGAG